MARWKIVAGIGIAAVVGTVILVTRQSPSPTASRAPRTPAPSVSTPAPSSPSPEPLKDIVIHATGDVNLDPTYVSGLATGGFAFAWSGLGGLFTHDDLTMVNMECPVAHGGKRQSKTWTFLGDPRGLPAMRRGGVDIATMANNHALDFGAQAMLETRRNLIANGVTPIGAGADLTEALRPAVVQAGGRRIAVISITDTISATSWEARPGRPGLASARDAVAVSDAIHAARREADVVVVAVHWGIELGVVGPTPRQHALGRTLIDDGADVVFGHGPHVLQPIEWYRGRPIFLSLGNFVWRRTYPEAYASGIAEVRVSASGRFTARIRPTYLESSGHPVLRG
jgi:poly-gamma-glutamate capsule biosynthesis protein CapA/YwtB (metallophosphatase superfamily)